MLQDVVGPDLFSEPNKCVLELCTLTLTPPRLNPWFLEKGLNFCPTPGEPKLGDLANELDHFPDILRWQ